jgi:hypothetical protein
MTFPDRSGMSCAASNVVDGIFLRLLTFCGREEGEDCTKRREKMLKVGMLQGNLSLKYPRGPT